MREYTSNPKEDEGRFKGWSSRAADDMTSHVVALSKSTPGRDVFNKMYRHASKGLKTVSIILVLSMGSFQTMLIGLVLLQLYIEHLPIYYHKLIVTY